MDQPRKVENVSVSWGLEGLSVSTPVTTPFLQKIGKYVVPLVIAVSIISMAQRVWTLFPQNGSAAGAVGAGNLVQPAQMAVPSIKVSIEDEQSERKQRIIEYCTELAYNYPLEEMIAAKERCILDEYR